MRKFGHDLTAVAKNNPLLKNKNAGILRRIGNDYRQRCSVWEIPAGPCLSYSFASRSARRCLSGEFEIGKEIHNAPCQSRSGKFRANRVVL